MVLSTPSDRSHGALVDVMLSETRDMAAAEKFFRSAKTVTGVTPARVTTDGHDSYPRAIRSQLGAGTVDAGWLTVGGGGSGTLTVQDGGQLIVSGLLSSNIGAAAGGDGTVFVDGGTVSLQSGTLAIGENSAGMLSLATGGIVPAPTVEVRANGTVELSGGTLAAIVTLDPMSILSGHGTIAGDIDNFGTVSTGPGTRC